MTLFLYTAHIPSSLTCRVFILGRLRQKKTIRYPGFDSGDIGIFGPPKEALRVLTPTFLKLAFWEVLAANWCQIILSWPKTRRAQLIVFVSRAVQHRDERIGHIQEFNSCWVLGQGGGEFQNQGTIMSGRSGVEIQFSKKRPGEPLGQEWLHERKPKCNQLVFRVLRPRVDRGSETDPDFTRARSMIDRPAEVCTKGATSRVLNSCSHCSSCRPRTLTVASH